MKIVKPDRPADFMQLVSMRDLNEYAVAIACLIESDHPRTDLVTVTGPGLLACMLVAGYLSWVPSICAVGERSVPARGVYVDLAINTGRTYNRVRRTAAKLPMDSYFMLDLPGPHQRIDGDAIAHIFSACELATTVDGFCIEAFQWPDGMEDTAARRGLVADLQHS